MAAQSGGAVAAWPGLARFRAQERYKFGRIAAASIDQLVAPHLRVASRGVGPRLVVILLTSYAVKMVRPLSQTAAISARDGD